ncbi:MAG: hypothetical protein PHE17_18130 [Thiothrix sp.]|uniref:hypothetical protein n=1 Tax=Thiothrix sp. TaxID=1032 RepID=UPI00261471A9|nr:hypothetical protein [Thiothrix sp.]MDD5394940.1 hypothetical protein [Thiothrix sp.]
MLTHPSWVAEMKKPVKDQITIVTASPLRTGTAKLRAPIGKQGTVDDTPEESAGVAPIGGKMLAGMSRDTGAGPDGEVQPDRVAGDVHEGETVLSAQATQNLPEDIRVELSKQAEEGTIDTNALRQALKIPEKPGFAAGTGGQAVDTKFNQTTPKALDAGFASTFKTPYSMPDYGFSGTKLPSVATTGATGTPSASTVAAAGPLPKAKADVMSTYQPAPAAPATTTAAAPNPYVPQPIVGQNQQNIAKANISRIDQIAAGNSKADQNIAAGQVRQFDTQAATGLQQGAQQIAALGNDVPANVKESMLAQEQSGVRGQRSDLQGKIAASEQANAQTAAQQAASLGLQSQGQQFNQGETIKADALNAAQVLINQGITPQNAGQIAGLMSQGLGTQMTTAQVMALGKSQNALKTMNDIATLMTNNPNLSAATLTAMLETQGDDLSALNAATAGGNFVQDIIANAAGKGNTVTDVGGGTVSVPTSGPGSSANGLFTSAKGNLYQNVGGVPKQVTDISQVNANEIESMLKSNPSDIAAVNKLVANMPVLNQKQISDLNNSPEGAQALNNNSPLRVNVNGKNILVAWQGYSGGSEPGTLPGQVFTDLTTGKTIQMADGNHRWVVLDANGKPTNETITQ